MQDLLRHASHKVYGCITQLMLMNADVIKIIDAYLTLQFFTHEILHKSWYYLLVNNLINYNILEEKVLSLRHGDEPIFSLDRLKSKLYELIARIALNKKNANEKKELLKATKAVFGFENDQELQQMYWSATNHIGFES